MEEQNIRVRHLSKSFGNRKVVDDLSFEVKRGEVFALLGHNGAGKSTTIDLILGLKMQDEGNARILGMDAAKNRKKVFERVGVQLQHTQYQNNITVEEAEALCDRVCIIKAGKKVAEGTVHEVVEASGRKNLEEAYLFFMGEEELL